MIDHNKCQHDDKRNGTEPQKVPPSPADPPVLISPYLDKRVDGHDGHVGLALGVVHQVEVDELLELQIIRLHAVDDVRE